ncbi:TetR/AcrR family transcriptional regulator [Actinomyces sp. oral taxon 414]|uniref:TetR/AcrR family transcriptional regulator n=1 Tax=Actinomyces sp. oral taxon 414 TaxID=712122 RepID=UPI0006AD9F57|nr:TetR/AcrR family transcriptional regulator [Actinomyces sp. oral taxon 414]
MGHSPARTRARILEAALAEFRDRGYERAGLRRIAAAARVTTGAVYNHFGSKEGLFDALVGESAAELVAAWTAGRDGDAGTPPADMPADRTGRSADRTAAFSADRTGRSADRTAAFSADRTGRILDLVYSRVEIFELLLCRARGTGYERLPEQLARIEAEAYRRLPGITDSAADRLLVRTLAASGVEALRAALEHRLTRPEARRYMERIARFRLAGWAGLLGPTPASEPAPETGDRP